MTFDINSQAKRTSEEVITACISNVDVSYKTIRDLVEISKTTSRGRLRLCAHETVNESVHEMFIVHPKGACVVSTPVDNSCISFKILRPVPGDARLELKCAYG